MSYEELRQEFTRESFREEMVRVLGCTCFNCGSEENIEYHHAVPLRLGGTNKMKNILALCHRCHMAAHTGRDINQIKINPNRGGRPKKYPLNPENELIMWMWAKGEIGTAECKRLLSMGKYVKIKETSLYKDFIEKHNIENVKNGYDLILHKYRPGFVYKTSIIYFNDDHAEEFESVVGKKNSGRSHFVQASGSDVCMTVKDGIRYRGKIAVS